MKIVILYSGGLDSLMMYKYAKLQYPGASVRCVFFDHGQDSLHAELEALPDFVEVKRLDWLGSEIKPIPKKSDPFAGPIYIPGRNLVFAATVASQYLPDEVWLGALADENNDQATDKNTTFLDKLNDTLKYVLSPFVGSVKVRFPFVDAGFTKSIALSYLFLAGVITEEEVKSTTSCWYNLSIPCGVCKQCFKRALILDQYSITEEHLNDPLSEENKNTMALMRAYMDCKNPNADEAEVQRLIRSHLIRKADLMELKGH